MTRTSPLALLLPLALASACNDAVPVLSSSTSSGSGATGTTASASSAGSGGNGGNAGSGGSTSNGGSTGNGGAGGGIGLSSSSSASSTGGPVSCAGVDLFVDVVGDGPTQHFTALCESSAVEGNPAGPVAYTDFGGGVLPSLTIAGCASSAFGATGLTLDESAPSAPGTDTHASATYGASGQTPWQSMAAGDVSVTLTHYEEIGGVVEGSYTATVSNATSTKMLSGTFRVCHVWAVPKP